MTGRTSLRAALVLALALPAAARAQAPAPADTLALTLGQAVALAGNGDEVALAEGRRDAAAAQVGQARAAGLPQLRLNSTFSHVYENARAQAVGQIFNQPNTYNTNLSLSLPLFQGGRIREGARAARGLRGAAEADIEDTRLDVGLQVLDAYLSALLADRLVAIQDSNLVLADARLRQVEQFERSGRASRYDVLRARVERANLEPLAIQARGDRELALLELKRLTNLPQERPLRLVSEVDSAAVRRLADELAALPADSATVANLPAVRAAALRAESQRAVARAARSGYLPTVSLNLVSGWQAFPQSAGFPTRLGELNVTPCPTPEDPDRTCSQQNGGWFSDRSMQLALSWPVFDGLRTRSDVRLARAQASVAQAQARQEREAAAVEVSRSRAELTRARALYDAGRLAVADAEEAFRLATLRYARGLGTQLDVSDAQLALLTARTNEARAAHELYLAAASLARALGRPVPLPNS